MAENWLKKHKTTPLDKLDPKIKNYLGSLPQELQNEIVITATSDGSHSKNSLHYNDRAIDLRFTDKLWNYISKDPNRHLAGLTLIDPNHGSAKHIHLSQAQGTQNEFYGEIDPQGRRTIYNQQGWDTSILDKRSDKTNKTISPPQAVTFTPIDTRTTQPVQDYVPEQDILLPTTPIQDFDVENWNPFGYVDGNILKRPIREVSQERKKEKAKVQNVVESLPDSPIKSAASLILGEIDNEEQPQQVVQPSTNQGWLASYQSPKPASSNKPGQYNAGNLRGKDGKFRSFNSPQEGKQALVDQLVRYQTGTNKVGVSPDHTLYEAMSIYAPAADKNNPRNYTNFIANKIRVTPDTKIKDIDPNKWADAISVMEGNKSYLNATKKEYGGWLSKY